MIPLTWHNEKRRITDLIPNDANPRTISPKQTEDLKKSLQKFDLVEIPVINLDNKVIAGHQRLMVMKLLGRENEEIDVRVPNRKLTKKEYDRYLLSSNRIHGDWDWEKIAANFDIESLLTSGFDDTDLSNIWDDLTVEDDGFNEEKELEKAKTTKIKPGDMFALGRHRLLCADALDPATVKKLAGSTQIDMINNDPPYNIGLSYDKGVGGKGKYGGTTNDSKSEDEYRTFVKTIMQNALSVTKPDAHIFFWCDERWVFLFQELYRELGIDSKRLCIWLKDNASPTPKVAFNKVTEYCVYGTRGKPYLSDKIKNFNEIANKEVTSGNRLSDDIMDLLNIWLVKRLPGNELEHPTQKNPTLHEKALRRCTKPGDTVLDLTAGSGSILSACHQLNRTAYVCDYEPVFCQLIINRFKKISNDKVTKLN